MDQLSTFTTVLMKSLIMNLQAMDTLGNKKFQGIQALVNGYLSIQLVPPQDLALALEDISQQWAPLDILPIFDMAWMHLFRPQQFTMEFCHW